MNEPKALGNPDKPNVKASSNRTPLNSSQLEKQILNATDLDAAFDDAIDRYGVSDSRVKSLYSQISSQCERQRERVARRAAEADAVNSSRAWAIERLDEMCNSFYPRVLDLSKIASPTLYDLSVTTGKDAAIAAAKDQFRTADNAVDMVLAGEMLLSTDAFPLDEVFRGQQQIGYSALSRALLNAALLRQCEKSEGCGPTSFTTVAYCADYGCRQGIDFNQALYESLSNQDYQAAQSILRWLDSGQRQ